MRERRRRLERACLVASAMALGLWALSDVVIPIIDCEVQVCPFNSWWVALLMGCWC